MHKNVLCGFWLDKMVATHHHFNETIFFLKNEKILIITVIQCLGYLPKYTEVTADRWMPIAALTLKWSQVRWAFYCDSTNQSSALSQSNLCQLFLSACQNICSKSLKHAALGCQIVSFPAIVFCCLLCQLSPASLFSVRIAEILA